MTTLKDLEARLTRLEELLEAGAPAPPGDFWALEAVKERLGDGVVFAGAVQLPQGRAEWQQALPTATVLEADEEQASERAESLAALGHPARLSILRAVLAGAGSVAELDQEDRDAGGRTYHHVSVLRAAGWLEPAGRGRFRIPVRKVVPLLVILAAA